MDDDGRKNESGESFEDEVEDVESGIESGS
jgi:hypothetical protein